jgi:hypothetical protein
LQAVRRNTAARLRVGGIVTALLVGAVVASAAPSGAALSAPQPPRSVRIVPGNKQAKVSWVKPSNGGSPITQYEVAVYHNAVVLGIHVFKSTATTQLIEGLKNSSTYTFKVAAKNAVGWGKFSARSAPATIGVPSPPEKPTAVAGKGRATVSWKVPSANSGLPVNGYRVTPILKGQPKPARVFSSTATRQVITGLASGKKFSFTVAARNQRGWGAPSSESNTVTIK